MWNRTQSEQTPGSKTDVIIIFTSDNSCVICFPLENKIKTYDVILHCCFPQKACPCIHENRNVKALTN